MTQPTSPTTATARRLADLTTGLVEVPPDVAVSDVTLDSRAVSPGALFLACAGRNHHGLEFADQVIARGASAVLYEPTPQVERRVPSFESGIFVAAVPDLSSRVGVIADRFFDSPSQRLTIAGITGTNGKTTCAWLLAQALEHLGRPAAYAGTLGYGRPSSLASTQHTTADAVSVHRRLAALRKRGAECVGMEVSSHALDQHRVTGVRFHTAVFTNLTRDHLDYHGSMEAYGEAKARLFSWPALTCRVVNIDDPFGAQLASREGPGRLVLTTRGDGTSAGRATPRGELVRAKDVQAQPAGLLIDIESSWGTSELAVPLVGDFNAHNALSVLAVLLAWDIPLPAAVGALAKCAAPSGRMEIFGGQGRLSLAIVDYAHTPDALANALRAARRHCRGRLRVVFGCGGDRDAGKRPLMGNVACGLADDIVLTDDNPRSEDPAQIVAQILAGIERTASVLVEHDRARAIRTALERSGPHDVVLIAGKGHEDYQIYGTTRRAFSDQAVLRAELGEQA